MTTHFARSCAYLSDVDLESSIHYREQNLKAGRELPGTHEEIAAAKAELDRRTKVGDVADPTQPRLERMTDLALAGRIASLTRIAGSIEFRGWIPGSDDHEKLMHTRYLLVGANAELERRLLRDAWEGHEEAAAEPRGTIVIR